jgi:hypothetical protein
MSQIIGNRCRGGQSGHLFCSLTPELDPAEWNSVHVACHIHVSMVPSKTKIMSEGSVSHNYAEPIDCYLDHHWLSATR